MGRYTHHECRRSTNIILLWEKMLFSDFKKAQNFRYLSRYVMNVFYIVQIMS